MKYTITQKFISKNRSGKALAAIGTVVHETATPNATDEAEFNYFNNGAGGRSASAHAFVDYDSITQTVPWNEQAWHAGPTANHTRIGIELCNYADKAKFDEVYKRAVWLFAYLHVNVIKQTTINKDTLMSHAEVSAKWKETDHTDPVAYFANFGKTVDMFRSAVQTEIKTMITPPKTIIPKYPGKASILGDKGGTVKLIQTKLNALGFPCGKVDGSFGPKTLAAVKAFQKVKKLVIDGKVGPITWAKLFN